MANHEHRRTTLLSTGSREELKVVLHLLQPDAEWCTCSLMLNDNAFPATEIIEYDQKYRKLMSHILDKV